MDEHQAQLWILENLPVIATTLKVVVIVLYTPPLHKNGKILALCSSLFKNALCLKKKGGVGGNMRIITGLNYS